MGCKEIDDFVDGNTINIGGYTYKKMRALGFDDKHILLAQEMLEKEMPAFLYLSINDETKYAIINKVSQIICHIQACG